MNAGASARLAVKVVPGAATSGIAGWLGDRLKVRVAAPPTRGAANRELIDLLARRLGVPVSRIEVIAGHGSPHKTLAIRGLAPAELARRLEAEI